MRDCKMCPPTLIQRRLDFVQARLCRCERKALMDDI